MKKLKYIVPNSLTLANLFFGCVAIILVFKGENEYNAAWFIFLAAGFDLFDGLAARALNAKSALGEQLDSLADIVSFGIAPSMILFNWFNLVLTQNSSTFEIIHANFIQNCILYSSFLFAMAAAIRLARFNISNTESTYFQGLPTPAAALFIAAIWLVLGNTESEHTRMLILNNYFVFGLLFALIFLMISKIKMLSLKFIGVDFKTNAHQYILILVTILLLLFFKLNGLIFSLTFYLAFSFYTNFIRPKKS